MAKPEIESAILAVLQEFARTGVHEVPSHQLISRLGEAPATTNRYIAKLLLKKRLQRLGKGNATRYCLAVPEATKLVAMTATNVDNNFDYIPHNGAPHWSTNTLKIKTYLDLPLGARIPVSYQRQWIDDYHPNTSYLLSSSLMASLYEEGRMKEQLPASTYARKVLEQLLIDLSWTSSKLEGNRYTLLATQELFSLGKAADVADTDAIMLLNHKEAIEFLVDAVPNYGLNTMVVRNVHGILMNNLLPDVEALGAIRRKIVNISGTVYLPSQNPHLLREMLDQIVSKASLVKNPIEAAFFLWINLAYLQPFEDGNKRVSRVCANIPLMLYNCAPLSFLDVDPLDYAQAMIGVYELQNIGMAVELFAWTYRRSVKKYSAIIESMGMPDAFRAHYRQQIGEAVRKVIEDQQTVDNAVAALDIPSKDSTEFATMLLNDLRHLDVYNCARYRLSMTKTELWIKQGKPGCTTAIND
jgi:Fic family protein